MQDFYLYSCFKLLFHYFNEVKDLSVSSTTEKIQQSKNGLNGFTLHHYLQKKLQPDC